MKVFFGKLASSNNQFKQQVDEKRYYAAHGSSWFNGIQEGDYSFILAGESVYLWRAEKFEESSGKEYLQFSSVINGPLPITLDQFRRLSFFQFNSQTIVISARQIRSKAFFELICTDDLDERTLVDLDTYKNEESFRDILVVDNFFERNSKDIYLLKTTSGYSLIKQSFIPDDVFRSYRDNTEISGGRPKKNATITRVKKASINSKLNISILAFYDLFFNDYGGDSIEDDDVGSYETNQQVSGEVAKNLILYGPPGTGKTYNTVLEAVKVCDGEFFDSYKDDYLKIKERYDGLKKEGCIEFVTFHQSYGYEEFIEGIRAESENGLVSYSIVPGVFSRLATRAGINLSASTTGKREKSFEEVFKTEVVEKVTDDSSLAIPMARSEYRIKEITDRTIYFDKANGDSQHSLAISTLRKMFEAGNNEIIRGGLQPYYDALLAYLRNHAKDDEPQVAKNFVLVIDEINRGNISKIFGELITLIEDDKRVGMSNSMTVQLPLSGREFGVPRNLYIIGTMNTADRSIAMMDTALRRRFEFKEMMPNPCLLHVELDDEDVRDWENINEWLLKSKKGHKDWIWDKDWDGDLLAGGKVNLRRMLHAINQRVEVLYDREHTIGHAYFMPLKDEPSIAKLASIFDNKVIPLLAEYFFEDWEKIRLVLGDNQKKNQEIEFVLENNTNGHDLLFGGEDIGFLSEQKVYQKNPRALDNLESYIAIYSSTVVKRESRDTKPA